MAHVLAMVTAIGSLLVAMLGVYRLILALGRPRRVIEAARPRGPDEWEELMGWLGKDEPELERPRQRILLLDERAPTSALVALIVASLAIAGATTLADANASPSDEPPEQHLPGSDGNAEGGSSGDEAFAGEIRTRHRVPRRRNGKGLCLIRYTEREQGLRREGGTWWTSCRRASSLLTVEEVKDVLALPARFGAVRDARTRALVPGGTRVTYREGYAAPQCEEEVPVVACRGHVYPGGGRQFEFPDPARTGAWIVAVECSGAREDLPSAWGPC